MWQRIVLTLVPESASSADYSLMVSIQAPCAISCISVCAHINNPKHWHCVAAIPLFEHLKILHALIGMGSAAFVAAVLYPGKVTCISCKVQ